MNLPPALLLDNTPTKHVHTLTYNARGGLSKVSLPYNAWVAQYDH
jgi:hypothetical protein